MLEIFGRLSQLIGFGFVEFATQFSAFHWEFLIEINFVLAAQQLSKMLALRQS